MKRLSLRILLIASLTLSITPSAFAADTSAPVLLDWKLIDLKTDISNGDGVLRIQFSVSDESEISEPLSNVGSTTTTQQTGFAFPKLISKVGNVSTYTAEATVKFGQAPGVWRWLFFPLRDVIGNSSQGFGPGGSWPINVWVYDKDFTEAKRLATEAAVANAKVDAANKATDAANKAAAANAAKEAANKAAAEAEAKAAAEQKLANAKANAAKPQIPVATAKLPSAYEAKLKLATKVKFGQAIPLAVPNCKLVKVKGKVTEKCTFEKFTITINSFKFFDKRTPIGVEESSYAIDLKLENYSSRENGLDVGEFLKCKSSRSGAPFYSDGINPQGIPAKSQDAGVVISSFPDEISIEKCESPVLWIQLSNSADLKDKNLAAEIKKMKLVGAAYIPLTAEMLVRP